MASQFQSVDVPRPPRSNFDLSHEVKTTFNMGKLVPFYCQEILPGDVFRVKAEIFMRMMPLISPVMHRVDATVHFFFVPNRLVWDNWQDFITLGEDGLSTPAMPYFQVNDLNEINSSNFMIGSLLDYFGIPVNHLNIGAGQSKINALPFRAYQTIYNEYYRDQNLVDKVDFGTGDGHITDPNELDRLLTLRNRAWEHDYFTSSLPFAQKGLPVQLPLSGNAPVKGLFRVAADFEGNPLSSGGTFKTGYDLDGKSYLINSYNGGEDTEQVFADPSVFHAQDESLYADLSGVSAATINDLRRAFQLQRFLERNARAGSRYIESIFSQFHVVSSDARLQRPEYLGGGKSAIVVSEVLQTSQTTDDAPLASMAGRAVSVGNSNTFSRYFEEHGLVIGLISVRPRTAYQDGINRMFSRFEALDYAFPVFAHLGEQEVYNRELFFTGNNPDNNLFGYQERYAEYRYCPDRISGDFRDTLAYWHFGRIFGTYPNLNEEFINCKPRTDPFAVQDTNYAHLISQIYLNIRAKRPLPRTGEPGYIDHF